MWDLVLWKATLSHPVIWNMKCYPSHAMNQTSVIWWLLRQPDNDDLLEWLGVRHEDSVPLCWPFAAGPWGSGQPDHTETAADGNVRAGGRRRLSQAADRIMLSTCTEWWDEPHYSQNICMEGAAVRWMGLLPFVHLYRLSSVGTCA